MNQDRVQGLLVRGYECLKNADLVSASSYFDQALREDFEAGEVLYALKCAGFWKEKLSPSALPDDLFARGDRILGTWKTFRVFLSRISGSYERAAYAFKRLVFGTALQAFLSVPEDGRPNPDPELEFRLGRCRKALGDYQTASTHLEKAASCRKDWARCLAELADCRGLSGETALSKAGFREAFYLEPGAVELDFLESEFILSLVERVRALGYDRSSLAEWIPVYGEIWGYFDGAAPLSGSELSRLNSSVLQLENELRENPSLEQDRKPRLLTRYFWLAAQYKAIGADDARVERLKRKISLLDDSIGRQYPA